MRGRGVRPAVLLCGETESYRRLARSQVLPSDVVLEIGCSYGVATRSLATRASRVLAVDLSADALRRAEDKCGDRFGNVRFELLDAVHDLARLTAISRAMGVTAVFVDVNGNRPSQPVEPLLHALHERLSPTVMVVKNRELAQRADAHQRVVARASGDGDDHTYDAARLPRSVDFWRAAVPADEAADATEAPLRWSGASAGLRGWALRRVERSRAPAGHPADSVEHRAMLASWGQTAGTHANAATLFSAPSEMCGAMRVEVRARADGWRTLHLVGLRREIMHGVARVDTQGQLEPRAVPTEYVLSMAALALAGGVARRPRPRCLFLGLGAGTLPKLLARLLPEEAKLVAIELDGAVCDAAAVHLGLDDGAVTVVRGDALRWVHQRATAGDNVAASGVAPFDAVFVDIFDEDNLCPGEFWGDAFLTALAAIVADDGIVVHNLHAGSRRLEAELRSAEAAYARHFGGCCRVSSLDSKPWAGNAIIGAARSADARFEPEALAGAAEAARDLLGVPFDLAARCSGVTPLRAGRETT
eukprot:6704123-Prymnesium_polylepis.1